jgi:succinyl-diaminopimelate desuccinylase
VPDQEVKDYGLESITNLIVRRKYGSDGRTVALNAHGDVVPPGEGWTHDPYGGEIEGGSLYGRAAAVSKSDFASFTFALRALEAVARPARGSVELHFTYDEEFGGILRPGLAAQERPHQARPDDCGRLQLRGGDGAQRLPADGSHGARQDGACRDPDLRRRRAAGAVQVLNALYAQNTLYKQVTSKVEGITHPYLNVGRIEGGTNTNVVPGKVVFKLDRRMIPEENPVEVEATIRKLIADAAEALPGITVEIKRLLLANSMKPLPGNKPLVEAIQKHGQEIFGEPIKAMGTPLYTDVRLYGEAGIPGVIYGAGPRTVLESHAKRNDERVVLEDLRRATKVIARTLSDLLS